MALRATIPTVPAFTVLQGRWDAIATARARAGLAISDTLLYVTGGAAFVDVNQSWCYYGLAGCGAYGGAYDVINKGWTVGFAAGTGIEHAITKNLRVKAEYLYIGLPNQLRSSPNSVVNGYGPMTFSSSAHLLRVGVNWGF